MVVTDTAFASLCFTSRYIIVKVHLYLYLLSRHTCNFSFWKSLPLCQLLRRPEQIPLLRSTAQGNVAPKTFFMEHGTVEGNDQSTRKALLYEHGCGWLCEEKLKSEAALLREKTISDERKKQLYRLFDMDGSLVQHYVAINLRLIAEAISDMTVLQKRQAAVFMGKKFRSKLGQTALYFPENITTDELSIPSLLTRLVPEFNTRFNVAVQSEDLFSSASALSSPWSVERKDCSHQLQLAFLDFFGWATRHHAWKIAQRICSDCLTLLPPRCIAAVTRVDCFIVYLRLVAFFLDALLLGFRVGRDVSLFSI